MKTWIVSCISFLCASELLLAGARIDLRPTPPAPPEGYAPDTTVRVDVFLVDTGNPQGDIAFRGIFLDLTDSSSSLDFPSFMNWTVQCSISCMGFFPLYSWVFPLGSPVPQFMVTMPNEGEVNLGYFDVGLGEEGGIVDVMNDDDPNPNYGAATVFGFGGESDPRTTWRSSMGELTGGVLELPVVPEPSACTLIAITFFLFSSHRRIRL